MNIKPALYETILKTLQKNKSIITHELAEALTEEIIEFFSIPEKSLELEYNNANIKILHRNQMQR